MALEQGSPAYLAIDKDLFFGDTFECPVGPGKKGSLQRFRITAIGEHHVLGRRVGFNRLGNGWEPDYGEGPEEILCREWIEGARRVG